MMNHLEILTDLLKSANSQEQVDAVKICLDIYKQKECKNPRLRFITADLDAEIYKKSMAIQGLSFEV